MTERELMKSLIKVFTDSKSSDQGLELLNGISDQEWLRKLLKAEKPMLANIGVNVIFKKINHTEIKSNSTIGILCYVTDIDSTFKLLSLYLDVEDIHLPWFSNMHDSINKHYEQNILPLYQCKTCEKESLRALNCRSCGKPLDILTYKMNNSPYFS